MRKLALMAGLPGLAALSRATPDAVSQESSGTGTESPVRSRAIGHEALAAGQAADRRSKRLVVWDPSRVVQRADRAQPRTAEAVRGSVLAGG